MLSLQLEAFSVQLALIGAVTVVVFALGGLLWRLLHARLRRRAAMVALWAIVVIGLVLVSISRRPDWDEMEHLHSAYLVSQGKLPYTQFWQHHSPALWIALAPLMKALPPGAWICDFARVFSLLVSLAACGLAALMARRLHGSAAGTPMILLLWLSCVEPLEFYNLRPDIVANLLSMGALLMVLNSRRSWRVLAGGVLLGVSLSLTPKHLPLVAVLPLVILWEGLGVWGVARVVALHGVGIVLGLTPLAWWLSARDLVGQFIFWVMQFNQDANLEIGGAFPVFAVVLVAAWLARIRANHWGALKPAERALIAALLATGAMYLLEPFHKRMYGQQMFLLMAVAVGSLEAHQALVGLVRRNRHWIAGALVGLILVRTIVVVTYWLPRGDYYWGRIEVGSLIAQAQGGPVLMVPPDHPVYATDATDLNQPWQWYKWLYRPEIKARLAGIVEDTIRARPTMILAGQSDLGDREGGEPFSGPVVGGLLPDRLVAAEVITRDEGDRLQEFIERNYRLVLILRHYYWVRKDLPLATQWVEPAEPERAGSAGAKG